jgi:uncharacterized protein (TIGR02246 family)
VTGDVADVEAANAALYAAVESADAAALADLWDELEPDAVACVHPGWPMLRGRSRVLRSFAAIMSGTPYIQFFLSDVEVRVLGDTAVVTCREDILTAVSEDEDGGAAVTTNVFVRRPDGWRLQAHHASPVLTAPDAS